MKKRTKNPAIDRDTLEQKEKLNSEKHVLDKDDKDDTPYEILGRSPSSWFKLILYSVTFDACNAVFWGLCLWVFYQTLDNYEPRLQVQRYTKRWTCFVKQQPGKARQKFIAT